MSSLDQMEANNLQEFKLIERVGHGSCGLFYKAVHIKTGTLVAMKKSHVDKDMEAFIHNEILLLQECQCENITRFYGSFAQAGLTWTVVEYCCFGSCVDIMEMRDSPFKEAEISAIVSQILLALDYLHSNQKVHRDLKGENILINETGQAKLADFGVSSTGSKYSTLVGTPYFVAPEVIVNNGKYDSKCDVWSLGIVCIELAERYPPYSNEAPSYVLYRIPTAPPPKLSNESQWSIEFNEFLAKCLTKEPQQRSSSTLLRQDPFILKNEESAPSVRRAMVEDVTKWQQAKSLAKKKHQQQLSLSAQSVIGNGSLNSDINTPRESQYLLSNGKLPKQKCCTII